MLPGRQNSSSENCSTSPKTAGAPGAGRDEGGKGQFWVLQKGNSFIPTHLEQQGLNQHDVSHGHLPAKAPQDRKHQGCGDPTRDDDSLARVQGGA